MNCKHLKVAGKTTKYFYCNAKDKAIDEYECKNCPLKLPDRNLQNELVELFFGKLK